eukprot:4258788-Ditylum_brightwellii.AAC.1
MQWTQVWFLRKKLLSMWFSKPVIMSVCQPDAKRGDIVIHVQSATLCMRGGRVHICRFLEPSWDFLGRSGGLGCKGAISRPCKAGSAMYL